MLCDSLLPCTLDDPRSLFAFVLPECPLAMKNNEENKRETCILFRQIKKLQRKRATYRFPLPSLSMLKVLTEE